jgi:hypothetical protein
MLSARPEKFGLFQLQADEMVQAIELAKQVITLSLQMEPLVLEEEQCFLTFQNWLRYGETCADGKFLASCC